jgi:hypothetical protein
MRVVPILRSWTLERHQATSANKGAGAGPRKPIDSGDAPDPDSSAVSGVLSTPAVGLDRKTRDELAALGAAVNSQQKLIEAQGERMAEIMEMMQRLVPLHNSHQQQ